MVGACQRLNDPADAAALHDFRVAVRRLRSWLRSYRQYLRPGSTGKTRRRLKRIARASRRRSGRRSDEIVVAIPTPLARLDAPHRLRPVASPLEARNPAANATLRSLLAKDFTRTTHALNASLSAYAQVVHVDGPLVPVTMAAAAATLLRRETAALAEAIGHVRSANDQRATHQTRIAGKRVRYCLKPLNGAVGGVSPLIRRLTHLQDAIGRWHDACVILNDVTAEADGPETSRSARTALMALSGRLHREQASGFSIIGHDWRGRRAAVFFAAVEAVARQLARRAPAGQEIERKYLLRELPERARHARAVLIDQGYVPGKKLIERLRRVRTKGAWRFFRTVKAGSGLTRTEIEEEATAGIFHVMWPLTKGRRVRKRRFTVSAGDRDWEIDLFLDREGLVLAEVELPAPNAVAEVPGWLAPSIIREVTGEAKYENANLAR